MYTLGIDIGSTTVKIAVLDENKEILFAAYNRHFANIQQTLNTLLQNARSELGNIEVHPVITGSGGLTLANHLDVPFTQEVIAVSTALQEMTSGCDVAIELGGEDAKIIYFEDGNVEQRMNGICAGGTGSFIDQMASLLQTDAEGLNAEEIVSIGNQTGEGWFLTGEMVELIQNGVKNIVCAQPFGCLPNHVVGKGVIKKLRSTYPGTNIVAIDYDPGASEVNQLNRIKLMLSTAYKNLE